MLTNAIRCFAGLGTSSNSMNVLSNDLDVASTDMPMHGGGTTQRMHGNLCFTIVAYMRSLREQSSSARFPTLRTANLSLSLKCLSWSAFHHPFISR